MQEFHEFVCSRPGRRGGRRSGLDLRPDAGERLADQLPRRALDEARARTVRFEREIELAVGDGNAWVQVVARGVRRMSDVLPFMPVPPFAFTNPVYIVRHPEAPPPFPGGEFVKR